MVAMGMCHRSLRLAKEGGWWGHHTVKKVAIGWVTMSGSIWERAIMSSSIWEKYERR